MAEAAGADTAGRLHWPGGGEDGPMSHPQEPPSSFGSKTRTTSNDSTTTYPKPSQKHHNAHAVNGKQSSRNSSRSRTRSRQGSAPHEQKNLHPNRLEALGKKENSLSRAGSEPDSLLDLYGRESANRSATSVMDATAEDKGDRTPQNIGNDDPNTYWIHRDKLAKIESEELQQLGIYVPHTALRSASKHSRGRTLSRDEHGDVTNGSIDQKDPAREVGHEDGKRQGTAHSAANEDMKSRDEPDQGEGVVFDDPRLPDEIAADPYEDGAASTVYRMPVLRKSSSKIPVLSSTRLMSHERLPHESPSQPQRSRTNTDVGGEPKTSSHVKKRSSSEPAPAVLDATESSGPAQTTPPHTSQSRNGDTTEKSSNAPTAPKSPVKQSTSTPKTSAPSNNRKQTTTNQKSNSNSNNKSPASSNTTPNNNQRPKTRSGDRPQTAVNRPEGDPPWLATMYKPDPRLPPDQQILPTHARKLAQEQWESEGKVPTTYDREFAPLSVQNDTPQLPPLRAGSPKKEQQESLPSPELRPPPSEMRKTPDLTNRPGTSGTDRGYKTMPNVQPMSSATVSANTRSPRPMAVEEPPKKEKGCGCCVVM